MQWPLSDTALDLQDTEESTTKIQKPYFISFSAARLGPYPGLKSCK